MHTISHKKSEREFIFGPSVVIMSFSSFLTSSVSRKGYAAARVRVTPKAFHNLVFGGRWIHSSSIPVSDVPTCSDNPPPPTRTSSPWLMLQPAFGGGDMIYKFYSLADKQVQSFNKSKKINGNCNCKAKKDGDDGNMPDHEALFVGSSHGWLIFFNRGDKRMFLSDPITRCHIRLPPINSLAIPESNLRHGYDCVQNVILSDPDDVGCRAMMIFGPGERLAFCSPGHGLEWTPIGSVYTWDDDDDARVERSYQSCVYSTKQKLFFTVDRYDEFEAWDLSDPKSPRRIGMDDVEVEGGKSFLATEADPGKQIQYVVFLVIAEHSDELFLVRRFFMQRMGPDGVHVERTYYGPMTGYSEDDVPDRTVGFDVHKYDPAERVFKYIDPGSGGDHEYDPEIKSFKYAKGPHDAAGNSGSLDGLAFFIGINHGFALRADEYPELKPNSIYFTDTHAAVDDGIGGHDVGIFNYDDGTFSDCYYPRDYASIDKRMTTAPMWFTPSPL